MAVSHKILFSNKRKKQEIFHTETVVGCGGSAASSTTETRNCGATDDVTSFAAANFSGAFGTIKPFPKTVFILMFLCGISETNPPRESWQPAVLLLPSSLFLL